MKSFFLCTVLLLAGSVSCGPVKEEKINLPEWLPEINLPDINLPDINLPDINLPDINLPDINWPDINWPEINRPEWPENWPTIPEIIGNIPDIIANLPLPDWFPDLDDIQLPEWWPPSVPDWWPPALPELPEININEPVIGTPATIEEFPSLVQVEVGAGPIWAQGCVGAIITNFHCLSAGQCFSGRRYDNRFRRVTAGSQSRFSAGYTVGVANPVINSAGDLAVVRLSSELYFSNRIQPSPIITQGFVLASGLPVTLASWGSTAQGTWIANRDLYKVDLSVIDPTTCAEKWAKFPGDLFDVGSNKLCVGTFETGGRNGDYRDTGAPMYFNGILVGVKSYAVSKGGNQYYPVVAAEVASHSDWIVNSAV